MHRPRRQPPDRGHARGGVLGALALLLSLVTASPSADALSEAPLWTTPGAEGLPLADIPLPARALSSLGEYLPSVRWNGRVADEAGEPVAGANVRVVPNGHTLLALGWVPTQYRQSSGSHSKYSYASLLTGVPWKRIPLIISDADGRFGLDVPHLPMGAMAETAEWGRRRPILFVDAPGLGTRSVELLWEGQRRCELDDIVLTPEIRATGRVVDVDGQPIPDAIITPTALTDHRRPCRLAALTPVSNSTRSAADGRFELRGLLDAHRWTIEVRAPGMVETLFRFEVDGRQDIDVGDVSVPRGRMLSGRVVDAEGAPVPEVFVHVRDELPDYKGGKGHRAWYEPGDDQTSIIIGGAHFSGRYTTRTDHAGGFELAVPYDGPLHVFAFGPGLEPGAWHEVGESEFELQLPRPLDLEVELVDARSGLPLASPRALAWRMLDTYMELQRALLTTPMAAPGTLRVRATGGLGTRVHVSAPGFRGTERIVEPGVERVVIELEPDDPVQVTVTDEHGQRLPDAWAEVRVADERSQPTDVVLGRGRTNALGDVRLPVGLGTVAIFRAPGYAERRVTPFASRDPAPVVLPTAASVALHLVDVDGSAFAPRHEHAYVSAVYPWHDGIVRPWVERLDFDDASGAWMFDGLAPGDYTVSLPDDAEAEITILAGELNVFELHRDGTAIRR